jgi:hypothetical protein
MGRDRGLFRLESDVMTRGGQAVVVGLAASGLSYLYGNGLSWEVGLIAAILERVRIGTAQRFSRLHRPSRRSPSVSVILRDRVVQKAATDRRR